MSRWQTTSRCARRPLLQQSLLLTRFWQTIDEVAQQLDEILFTDFIKRKGDAIADIFRTGILSSDIAWHSIPKPAGECLASSCAVARH